GRRWLPLAFLALRTAIGVFARFGREQSDARTRANSRMVEYIQGIPVIRAFNLGGARLGQFQRALDSYRVTSRRTTTAIAPAFTIFIATVEIGFAVLILVGAWLFSSGALSAPVFLLLLVLASAFYAPLLAVGDAIAVQRMMQNSVRNVNAFLRSPLLPEAIQPQQAQGFAIAFEKVFFDYGEGQPVLNDVSFRIPERSITALVGPSGSGKSTITNLIARFWDVTGGRVSVGGVDVRELSADTLLGMMTMVFQDVYLFNDTIGNNIRLGKPTASDAEVEQAARLAQIHSFIADLPQGYDTVVGEGGNTLSGGQKQRISIARAILKDAPIVLLDEATASIDPENEQLIQQAFNALAAQKTLVIIAHRLTTIQQADQILVLEAGQIVEHGSHDTLIANDGLYRRFWRERAKARDWKLGASLPATADSTHAGITLCTCRSGRTLVWPGKHRYSGRIALGTFSARALCRRTPARPTLASRPRGRVPCRRARPTALYPGLLRRGGGPAGCHLLSAWQGARQRLGVWPLAAGSKVLVMGPGNGGMQLMAGDWHLFLGDETTVGVLHAMTAVLAPTTPVLGAIEVAADERGTVALFLSRLNVLPRRPMHGAALDAWLAEVTLPPGHGAVYLLGHAQSIQRQRAALLACGLERKHVRCRAYWADGKRGLGGNYMTTHTPSAPAASRAKYLLLASLYIAQYLGMGFFFTALVAILRQQGVPLGATDDLSINLAVGALFLLYSPTAAVLSTVMMDNARPTAAGMDFTLQYCVYTLVGFVAGDAGLGSPERSATPPWSSALRVPPLSQHCLPHSCMRPLPAQPTCRNRSHH
ncbi:ATP-binding cassette domain-containing protein, partial [Candidatus Gracilibacteria bacterium]|nr:ATP-binding cassette domain-containing protein [Candidatus Gracilibacteria bacterium]